MTRALNTIALSLLTTAVLWLVPGAALAQQSTPPTDEQLSDPEVSVVLEGRQRSRFRMAMPALQRRELSVRRYEKQPTCWSRP